MSYKGIYPGEGADAFAAAAEALATYELPDSPDSPDKVRELKHGIPDYRGRQPSTLRFFMRHAEVVFDIHRPEPEVTDESGLIIQIRQTEPGEQSFPGGELPDTVFDSQLGLRGGQPRLLVARSGLYREKHKELLAQAGLGDLVVANLTDKFGPHAPYGSFVEPDTVRAAIPQLPERLVAMAAEFR